MPDSTATIVERCLAGDQRAVTALVERFQSAVFSLCLRMLGSRHDAEDVAQESFLRAIRSLACFDVTRDFEPWLLAIAGNRCRTWLAQRKRRPTTHGYAEEIPAAAEGAAAETGVAEEVQRALERVRPEYRHAFLLFHQHEMSYAEIGDTLGVPLGTVKTWVHRARQELMEHLRQRGVVEETQYAVRRV